MTILDVSWFAAASAALLLLVWSRGSRRRHEQMKRDLLVTIDDACRTAKWVSAYELGRTMGALRISHWRLHEKYLALGDLEEAGYIEKRRDQDQDGPLLLVSITNRGIREARGIQ